MNHLKLFESFSNTKGKWKMENGNGKTTFIYKDIIEFDYVNDKGHGILILKNPIVYRLSKKKEYIMTDISLKNFERDLKKNGITDIAEEALERVKGRLNFKFKPEIVNLIIQNYGDKFGLNVKGDELKIKLNKLKLSKTFMSLYKSLSKGVRTTKSVEFIFDKEKWENENYLPVEYGEVDYKIFRWSYDKLPKVKSVTNTAIVVKTIKINDEFSFCINNNFLVDEILETDGDLSKLFKKKIRCRLFLNKSNNIFDLESMPYEFEIDEFDADYIVIERQINKFINDIKSVGYTLDENLDRFHKFVFNEINEKI